jgi:hypothetical protein
LFGTMPAEALQVTLVIKYLNPPKTKGRGI